MNTTIRSLSYAYHFELVLQMNTIMSIYYYGLTLQVRDMCDANHYFGYVFGSAANIQFLWRTIVVKKLSNILPSKWWRVLASRHILQCNKGCSRRKIMAAKTHKAHEMNKKPDPQIDYQKIYSWINN